LQAGFYRKLSPAVRIIIQEISNITLQKVSTRAVNKLSITRKKPKKLIDAEKLCKQKNSDNLQVKTAALGRFITFKRISSTHGLQL
jgi:hypothetical protein